MLVCRGCCCGTDARHPDVDHAAHLATLRAAMPSGGSAKLWTVDCLGPCNRSNVVVVRNGSTRRWFGDMLDDDDIETLAAWVATGAVGSPPDALASNEFTLVDEVAPFRSRPLRLSTDELRDLVERRLCSAGTWTMGVHGAVAEFAADGASVQPGRDGRASEAFTSTGAIRIDIDSSTRAFQIERPGAHAAAGPLVIASTRSQAVARHVITELGADHEAIHDEDRSGVLFDLGLGRASAAFCVRAVGDGVDLLRVECGTAWVDVAERLAPMIVERAPHRVVLAGGGRTEVTSPIRSPGASSPTGSHTHLVPGELELGRDLPLGVCLPAGCQPVAMYLPPVGAPLMPPAVTAVGYVEDPRRRP